MAKKSDIAKLAGVSASTVSNFFSGTKKFSAETKQRIIDAANQLNYPIPNQAGNSIESQHTLLVVDDVLNPHYGSILKGMNSVASNHYIPVSMIPLWSNVDAFCDMIIAHGIKAVYFATYSRAVTPEHIQFLKDHDICVYFSWNGFSIDFDTLVDKAIKYLVDLGHKNIVYLSGLSIDDPDNIRYTSYRKALENNHLPFRPELVIDGIYPYSTDAKSGCWAMRSFLEKDIPFTAVIALNDLLAIGASEALSEHGLSIPKDVSIIGCDDIMISEYVTPPLTTLRFSASDIGKRIMYSIIQQHSNEAPVVPVSLQTELVIRKSTGKAPEQ